MKISRFIILTLTIVVSFSAIVFAENEPFVATDNYLISERLERARQTYPIRLSEQEQTRLSGRCANAQKHLSRILARLDAREAIIGYRFNLVDAHLSAVKIRLENMQQDTSIINLLLSNYEELLSTHNSVYEDYRLSLSDAISVECADDPQLFKAVIEDIRTKRQLFVGSIENIKNFTTEDLKTSFDAIRTRINSIKAVD